MNSKFLSHLAGANKHFKSLPDDRRVFFADYPWSANYVIPNPSIEKRLLWLNFRANVFVFSSFILTLLLLLSFKSKLIIYSGAIFLLILFIVGGITRWVLFRNELANLQKIDVPSSISSFYKKLGDSIRVNSQNSFPNYDICLLLSIPNSQKKIVMLKFEKSFSNILRCRLDGSIVWQAELPETDNDVYTNVEWIDGKLRAFTRSCISVLLDEKTGKIVSS